MGQVSRLADEMERMNDRSDAGRRVRNAFAGVLGEGPADELLAQAGGDPALALGVIRAEGSEDALDEILDRLADPSGADARLVVDGEVVDTYSLPDYEHYEIRSPGGSLIAELGGRGE